MLLIWSRGYFQVEIEAGFPQLEHPGRTKSLGAASDLPRCLFSEAILQIPRKINVFGGRCGDPVSQRAE